MKWVKAFVYSPWVYHLHAGGCNGCDIELVAALMPKYDSSRFGFKLASSPRHADILVVTGPVPQHMKDFVLTTYEQVPDPKVVVVVGHCGISGGVFLWRDDENYAIAGPLNKLIPVDVYVPGCPPKPEAVMSGLVLAAKKLAEKASGGSGG